MSPFKSSLIAALIGAAVATSTTIADPVPAGFVDFGKFTPSAAGGEFVEVKLSRGLIQMASKITRKHEPEVADLLRSLESVRVNVIPLGDDNRAETEAKVAAIRTELEGKGWEKVVSVRERDQDVAVLLKTKSDASVDGVVVTVIENGRQAVFVNVVGNINFEDLSRIGDQLDLGPLKEVGKAVSKESAAKDGQKQNAQE